MQAKDKFCIIILGPESSGGRLIKRILLTCGCDGSVQDSQKWDSNPPFDEPLVVWHKSVPYGRKWPDLPAWISDLRIRGYKVKALVATRDWFPMTVSGKRHHALFFNHEVDRARKAFYDIFKALYEGKVPYFVVSYEALILHPRETFAWICQELELPFPTFDFSTIVDGDSKYYVDFETQLKNWKISAFPPNR